MEDINKKPKYIAEVLTEALPYIKKLRSGEIGYWKRLNMLIMNQQNGRRHSRY